VFIFGLFFVIYMRFIGFYLDIRLFLMDWLLNIYLIL